jgi:hypothetical protein
VKVTFRKYWKVKKAKNPPKRVNTRGKNFVAIGKK